MLRGVLEGMRGRHLGICPAPVRLGTIGGMSDLPANAEELYQQLNPDIERLVMRFVKYRLSRPDVVGELWLRLLAADVLGKFHASTRPDKPATPARLRAYVWRAAKNHLANIFRTHTRRASLEFVMRHAERYPDGSDHGHVEPWESALPARTISPERFCIVMSNTRARWKAGAAIPA